ncbi:MAG: response regulator [Patescibacteria group bacterium]|jgi:DNA-binding response OmpR family regulator
MTDKIKVLLVEDDLMIIKMYERKFDMENFKLTIALNGKEAMKILKKDCPNIVLLDIMMPKMNGLEVLKEIKADSLLRDIPVVMLTNLGDRSEDVEKCKELGAEDYWVKANTSLEEILQGIKNILSKK